jgi:mono/diheme cytochrome c family protein
MHYRYTFAAISLLAFLPNIQAVEPSELKPGLVASFSESAEGRPGTIVTRLEPTVALSLSDGEASHPRMNGTGSAMWKGYINVLRPGKYAFSSTLRGGSLTVKIGGKSIYTAIADDKTPLTKAGQEVTLEGGVQPFEAVFFKNGTNARVELFWQGPGFIKEPLPHQFLGHLPRDRPAQFAKDVQLEHGRFKFEELSCIRCHKPTANDKMAKGLVDHIGPNLTEVGKRDYAGWLDAWLADPSKLRPQTTMPKMFTDDATGKAERYAVVKYLVSLSGPPLEEFKPPVSNEYRQSMDRGKVLFTVTGCAACHTDPQAKKAARNDEDEKEPLTPEDSFTALGTLSGPTAKYNLGALGSKYRPETLAAFLQNPLKSHTSGRMPNMNLTGNEAQDISRYLCRVGDDNIDPALPTLPNGVTPATIAKKVLNEAAVNQAEIAKYEKLNASAQWNYLGEKLLVVNGCVNCHAIEPGGKKLEALAKMPSLEDIRKADAGKGCLAEKPDLAEVPEYKFDAKEKTAIAAFLKSGLTGAGSPAPSYSARVALRRFNCLNCHSRDGEGGISVDLANEMRLFEKAENADDVRPPLLTGIGHKVRTSWMKAVLTQSGRARPWMQLRMPQYGEANVGFLPESLAALEGTNADDSVHKVQLSAEKITAGRMIVGKGGLGCISCHDIAGIANTGTRGPDLSTINQRVRYDWYERWLHQPLRMAPGTRMPQAFVDGKSTLATVMNGNPDSQADAMWAYLSLGPGLPLPEGLEPPKGLIIAVKNRPELLRTFLPEAGNKAIAVGYPGGISVAFSADQCRLTYAWAGNYLDASPVWNNRGGAPAKLLGPKFWTAPPSHPWGLTVNPNIPPDFLGRTTNPAYGMPLPLEPARIYDGPLVVGFDGYSLEADGTPTFRYHLTGNRDAVLNVSETIAPMQAGVATGFQRRFQAGVPAGYRAWFLAGSTNKEPRIYAAGWTQIRFDGKAESQVVNAEGITLVLPADGDKAVVLRADKVPLGGTKWRFVPKSGGGWLVILQLPIAEVPLTHPVILRVLTAPRDDDALLKGLGN